MTANQTSWERRIDAMLGVAAESLLLETRDGGDYMLTNTSFTYNGKLMTTSTVASVGFGCDNGDNIIDASAWTLCPCRHLIGKSTTYRFK